MSHSYEAVAIRLACIDAQKEETKRRTLPGRRGTCAVFKTVTHLVTIRPKASMQQIGMRMDKAPYSHRSGRVWRTFAVFGR